jgi:hypothetical protein
VDREKQLIWARKQLLWLALVHQFYWDCPLPLALSLTPFNMGRGKPKALKKVDIVPNLSEEVKANVVRRCRKMYYKLKV